MDKLEPYIDPSISTYLDVPNSAYNRGDLEEDNNAPWNIEIFISLICHGILNVCQVIEQGNKEFSIPIDNPKQINLNTNLKYQEIVSDIILYMLITGEGGDVDFMIGPKRDVIQQVDNIIDVGCNCIIYEEGTYSIFDVYDDSREIKEDEVIKEIIENIKILYGHRNLDFDIFDGILFFPLNKKSNNFFLDRMLKKVNEFLERYEGEDGKDFFMKQILHSANFKTKDKKINNPDDIFKGKAKKRYNELIITLRSVKKVISKENAREDIREYVSSDKCFIEEELTIYADKITSLLREGGKVLNPDFYKQIKDTLLSFQEKE